MSGHCADTVRRLRAVLWMAPHVQMGSTAELRRVVRDGLSSYWRVVAHDYESFLNGALVIHVDYFDNVDRACEKGKAMLLQSVKRLSVPCWLCGCETFSWKTETLPPCESYAYTPRDAKLYERSKRGSRNRVAIIVISHSRRKPKQRDAFENYGKK